MKIPFIGGAYAGASTNLNAQVCQNLYPCVDQQGGKSVLSLMGTPGLKFFCKPGSGEVRGRVVMGGYLFAVIGNAVYMVDTDGDFTAMTGSLGTSAGPVRMRHNGTQVMIVDGAAGYILSGTTVTAISAAGLEVPGSMDYQDGYFIVTKKNGKTFQISGSYDGTAWDAADFATAEGYPDNLVVVVSSNRELWLLGSESYEVWYNSGDSAFPFDRVSGAVAKVGCLAPDSAAEYQGNLAWLDHERRVRKANGYGSEVISTPQVDHQIGKYTAVEDARGFIYGQEGHTFYQLTFPSEGKTWCFDFTTGFWHTRASGAADLRHPATCHVLFDGKHVVGDEHGNLLYFDPATHTDNGTLVRRVRAAQAVTKDRQMVFHNSLEIEFEAGVGAAVDDPALAMESDPQAMLEWSDDGGHTWSNEHWVAIGKIGQYARRAIWRRMGKSRDRIYRVTVSDPVKVVMIDAILEAS